MAIMQTVRCGKCLVRNDRLEMQMVVTFAGAPNQTYTFNVSHKKHAISSYKTNSTSPPTADVNTLVNMSENEFKVVFDDYGRQLALKMVGKDNMTFNPSAPMNRVVTKQIAFSSDAANLGGNVHCFPFNKGPAETPKAISIGPQKFNHFKVVAQFLFRTGTVPTAGARNSWADIRPLVENRTNQLNQLFTANEIQTLNVRLAGQVDRLVRQDLGVRRRAENMSGRLNPSGRAPFRG